MRTIGKWYPQPRIISPPVSAAAAAELNAEPGAYAVTGAAATLLRDLVLDAAPGSYAITGFSAQTLVGRALSANPDAYVISGFDAALEFLSGATLDAGPGVYAIAGFEATLEVGAAPPDRRPMGFYGVSFRKRRRQDDDKEIVEATVQVGAAADKAEVAEYVAARLESAGVLAKDVAGLLAEAEGVERLRIALEGLSGFEWPEEVELQQEAQTFGDQELSSFLEEFLRQEPMRFGIREKDLNAYLIGLLVNEL